jgi:hypothetical protein
MIFNPPVIARSVSDAAIQCLQQSLDCRAALAMAVYIIKSLKKLGPEPLDLDP